MENEKKIQKSPEGRKNLNNQTRQRKEPKGPGRKLAKGPQERWYKKVA